MDEEAPSGARRGGCYAFAMFERTNPKTLRTWLILAALVYLVVPYDVLPDFFGLPGRIDDVLLMAWCVWLYTNHVRRLTRESSSDGSTGRSAGDGSGQDTRSDSAGSKKPNSFDPYATLGVPRSASNEAIQAAYRRRMQEYHPDKVAHLGAELQALAHEKSQEIQRAYRQLRG
jgi:uncharacterized membrane protein YkvA (DUF1232 family)